MIFAPPLGGKKEGPEFETWILGGPPFSSPLEGWDIRSIHREDWRLKEQHMRLASMVKGPVLRAHLTLLFLSWPPYKTYLQLPPTPVDTVKHLSDLRCSKL